jgi:hypothetical protein
MADCGILDVQLCPTTMEFYPSIRTCILHTVTGGGMHASKFRAHTDSMAELGYTESASLPNSGGDNNSTNYARRSFPEPNSANARPQHLARVLSR